MKVGTITFLKATVIMFGLITLSLCMFALPQLAEYSAITNPEYAYLQFPVLIGIYITALPFFYALYQAFKLLHHMNRKNIFSNSALNSLKLMKNSAIIIIVLYVFGMIILALLNALHPGIAMIGIAIIFATLVFTVFIAVLRELLKTVIIIKSENDLSV